MQQKDTFTYYLFFILLLTTGLRLGALGTGEKNATAAVAATGTPQRIVSLGPVLTEELYLLEAADKLAGNTTYCINPPAAQSKPKVGSVMEVDLEKLLSLKPDLVLATSLTNPEQMAKLKNLGIRVEVFPYPKSYQEICASFLLLGSLLGREEAARRIVEQSQQEADRIKSITAPLTKTNVFVQVGANPLFTTPRDTFIHSFIELAGGRNIAEDTPTGLYSREKVLAHNPDVILIVTMGLAGEQEKEIWQKYPAINAVKYERIFSLDSYEVCSPTPQSFIKVLKDLLPLLHPESNSGKQPEGAAAGGEQAKPRVNGKQT